MAKKKGSDTNSTSSAHGNNGATMTNNHRGPGGRFASRGVKGEEPVSPEVSANNPPAMTDTPDDVPAPPPPPPPPPETNMADVISELEKTLRSCRPAEYNMSCHGEAVLCIIVRWC